MGLDSEEAASNYKHEGTSEDLPREFRRDWACCGGPRCCGVFRIFQCSVETDLSIIDVPYVAFGDLVDSSLCTLTVTSLGNVTEVLSPAFDAGTLFYEVNVTSVTYTVDASASSDAATGLGVDGKAAPAIYTVHSTAPAYQEIRVLVSARDATTTTYIVHAFFQPCVGPDVIWQSRRVGNVISVASRQHKQSSDDRGDVPVFLTGIPAYVLDRREVQRRC